MRCFLPVLVAATAAACTGDHPAAPAAVGRPSSVLVLASTRWVEPGDTLYLSMVRNYDYMSGNQYVEGEIVWRTPDPSIADIDSRGFLTARGYGKTVVTAENAGQTATMEVVVARPLRDEWAWVTLSSSAGCAGNESGRISCWGDLPGGVDYTYVATERTWPIPFGRLSLGTGLACGLTSERIAYCWGNNSIGQLGNGTTAPAPASVPSPVSGGLKFVKLDTYGYTSCGITVDLAAWCWGVNIYNHVTVPERLLITEPLADIATTAYFTCALTVAGEVYCWGSWAVQPWRLSTPVKFTSIDVTTERGCGLSTDRLVYCWARDGVNSVPAVIPGNARFSSIAASGSSFCALDSVGIVQCWGDNSFGALGNGTRQSSDIPLPIASSKRFRAVVRGEGSFCAIDTEGAINCWGSSGWPLGNQNGVHTCSIDRYRSAPCRETPRPVLRGD